MSNACEWVSQGKGGFFYTTPKGEIVSLQGLTKYIKKNISHGKIIRAKKRKRKKTTTQKNLAQHSTVLNVNCYGRGLQSGRRVDVQCNRWVKAAVAIWPKVPRMPYAPAAIRALRFCLKKKWVPVSCQQRLGDKDLKVATRADMIWKGSDSSSIPRSSCIYVVELKRWEKDDFIAKKNRKWKTKLLSNVVYSEKNIALIQLAFTVHFLKYSSTDDYDGQIVGVLLQATPCFVRHWYLPPWASDFVKQYMRSQS